MSGGWHSFTTLPDSDWPEEQARRIRRHKVERLLESVDLTPEEFIRWLWDSGIKRQSTESLK